MTVALDHVILPTNDQVASAALLSRMLGLPDGMPVGHFICIPNSPTPSTTATAAGLARIGRRI